MNDNTQLIEYGNKFLKLFKEQFKDYISFKPLITFLINNDKQRAEMKLDIKTDNGNQEKLKDIEIIKYSLEKIKSNEKIRNLDDLEKLYTKEEKEEMKEIRENFLKRHGDYYTASIFKNIDGFTKDEVEKDFKSIYSFNFLRKESKEEIFFKTDYNNLSEEDKDFYNQAKELIEAGAIDNSEEFEKFSEEQKDNIIKTWALDIKKEQEAKCKRELEEEEEEL